VADVPPLAKWAAAVSTAALGVALLPSAASPAPAKTITIRVDAVDFAYKLSRRSVPAGSTVRFVVRNTGGSPHDFVVAKKKGTRVLRPGGSQTISVRFPKAGTFRFLCSIPGHARLGMKGGLGVSKPAPPAEPEPPPIDTSDVASLSRVGSFERPVLVTAPPGETNRLFVVEQAGTVRVISDGVVLPRPFLDLSADVKLTSEPGLLSIAFAPDYAESGRFYAFYNSRVGNGDIRISEFRRHPTDPDLADRYTERVLLTVVKPWENHNGGMLQFGPDGYLYASIGDGDSGVLNPPGFFAQSRENLLGTIIRIDPRGDPYAIPDDNPYVDVEDALPEIWAYGLRNPWRFSIDHRTAMLFVGDAGNSQREEIDLLPLARPGANLGWPCFEGTAPFDTAADCTDAVGPLVEYTPGGGSCAVVGGVVVRDARLPELAGRYLYGDFCAGKVTAVAVENERAVSADDLGVVVPEMTSFGVDALDRVYLMSLRGDVFRLDPKRAT
jgi:glucose/arabinose dehydrogenase